MTQWLRACTTGLAEDPSWVPIAVGHLKCLKAKLQGIQGLSRLGSLYPNVHTPPHKHRIKNKSYFLKGKFGIYSSATPAEVLLLFGFCIQDSLEQN